MALKFTSVMQIVGLNPYVKVSRAQAATLQPNWRKAMPVLVRVNGAPREAWRINMMPAGDGSFYLYLHEIVRKASKTKVGDTVEVELDFDEAYKNGPLHPMPQEFAEALARDAKSKANWETLAPSRQKEILRYFAGLKSPEAKVRNVEKAMHVLSGNPGRFMAREWRDGS